MNWSFKAIGGKPWSVTESALVFDGANIPYNELKFFTMAIYPSSRLFNGVAQGEHNGEQIVCAFKYADRDEARKAIDYVADKVASAQKVEPNCLFCFTSGNGSTLKIFESYATITKIESQPVSITGLARQVVSIKNEIEYDSVESISINPPTPECEGQIRFKTRKPGSLGELIGSASAPAQSFPIKFEDAEKAEEAKAYIEKTISKQGKKPNASNQASGADILMKYKELLDMGAITQDEFDAKKKQVLETLL